MDADKIYTELLGLLPKLEKLSQNIDESLYAGNDMDENERFLVNQLRSMNHRYLNDLSLSLRYLSRSVRVEGVLHKQANERYAINDYELTSGSSVELLVWDEGEGRDDWEVTRIEYSHQHGGYYAIDYPEMNLEGVKARIRK